MLRTPSIANSLNSKPAATASPREAARVVKLLKSLGAARFRDSLSLIRFHEALLFLRAFPQGQRWSRHRAYPE